MLKLFCREAVIINRLRLGLSRLTHSYLMSGDDQPTCEIADFTYSEAYSRLSRFAGHSTEVFYRFVSEKPI